MKRLRRGVLYSVVVSFGTVVVCGAFLGAIDALAYAYIFYANLPDSWNSFAPQYVDFDLYMRKMAPPTTRYSFALLLGWFLGAASFIYGVLKRVDEPEEASSAG